MKTIIEQVNDTPDPEETWTEHSRHEAQRLQRIRDYHARMAALNARERPPTAADIGRRVIVAYGCMGLILGAGVLFGMMLHALIGH